MTKRAFWFISLGVLALTFGLMARVGTVAAQSEGQISGIVYADKNGNGVREEGEKGIKDVEVTFSSGGWSTTINTTDTGSFSIAVNPATWTVSVKPPQGYTAPDASTEVFIEKAGDVISNVEFGLVPKLDSASGETLPASGGIVSTEVLVGGLVGMMAIGGILVVIGQRRSRNKPL